MVVVVALMGLAALIALIGLLRDGGGKD